MDPLAVLRTIWQQRLLAIPAILITVIAAVGVYIYGPREYESTISYALVNPKIPTEKQLDLNPALAKLNSDNPYLRSSDPDLVANVVITRLNSPSTADRLRSQHLGTDFLAAPGASGGGLIVSITASGDSPRQSLATTDALARQFESTLHTVQKINGADDRYLFTALVVDAPDRATEKLSSRLRTLVIVVIGGIILIFGSVSLGTWISGARRRRPDDAPATEDPQATPEPSAPGPTEVPGPAAVKRAPRARPAATATRAAATPTTTARAPRSDSSAASPRARAARTGSAASSAKPSEPRAGTTRAPRAPKGQTPVSDAPERSRR